MAYLLIRERDNTCGDPAKDAVQTKRGSIIAVWDDDITNTKTLTMPCPSPWVWVKISGVTKAQCEKYLAPHVDAEGNILMKRLYRIRWEDLPTAVKNALKNDRYYETTWTAIKSYVRNQVTGVDE